ncbi:MAG: branched-chain amino acid ABC transporter ATP-binding protein [Stappia sp.]|uniref:ABC transporter ATP-binding protein n=1 Tax=Stappia sp. TaxID=1870903 RepID=UPI000C6A6E21|nr:ABC transporter ATP-binding protein [Stappia sp.]MAB00762.1 branched-chain amino acid ABC transporter ATP-binding protein [Stappia sp.]MBM18832.1 branched-chain amino acid ABC transporter ATP-binding protein [Stappia sp.]|tara:strand:- start:94 stop:828 length:735 start_codon:yes stop_codon:yes gene_type:complete
MSASANGRDALLEIAGLTAGYGAQPVLHDVSLKVDRNEFVAVIGANTAGKSTLLRAISGLLPRCEGRIAFEGEDLTRLKAHEIAGLGIAHVPEGRHVFPEMTVEENLKMGAYSHANPAHAHHALERVYELFPRLRERRTQLAGSMSGGEQQMVAVGRGMMLDPKLLILDEPSLGLAPLVVEEMHQRFLDIHQSGVTVLLVEQNVSLALHSAERAYVMASGVIEIEGAAKDLLHDDRIRKAYLGI